MKYITSTVIYNFLKCPHRVWLDFFGPLEKKILEKDPFLQLLWDKGVLHEEKVVEKLGHFLDLKAGSIEERYRKTIEALNKKDSLIYQGLLKHEHLLGIPDLLKLRSDGTYFPVDIKSGMGLENNDESEKEDTKLKKHYAMQLSLYHKLLHNHGYAREPYGEIIDIRREVVPYNLLSYSNKTSKKTWMDLYQSILESLNMIYKDEVQTKPALSSNCKICPWKNYCDEWLIDNNDPTNVFYIGRKIRDQLEKDLGVSSIEDLLKLDLDEVFERKDLMKNQGNNNFLLGVGKDTLKKAYNRAQIYHLKKPPSVYESISFPRVDVEVFFDIEDDPTQDYVYLHGVYERTKRGCRYISFFADDISSDSEKEAWKEFWDYIKSLPRDSFALYYYSSHEKSVYRKMQIWYPEVISIEAMDDFFNTPNAIDLYSIIYKFTDWPVRSYSIKEIATFLGFKWRDETPSGAQSIIWYNKFIDTGEESHKIRLLQYNEDDCIAMMVVKDALVDMQKK